MNLQPLSYFSSHLMYKLITERDYSAQGISHLLFHIPLEGGTWMVVSVDCRPLEPHARLHRVDRDVNKTIGSYRKYLERTYQCKDATFIEYLQSYYIRTWRRLLLTQRRSYPASLDPIEASPQFNYFCRVKLIIAHLFRSLQQLLVVNRPRLVPSRLRTHATTAPQHPHARSTWGARCK